MKKTINGLCNQLIVLLTVFFSSCSTLFIANSSIEPIVFTKPSFRDSAIVTSYASAKFNKSDFYNTYSDLKSNYFGQISWSQTQTEQYLNVSYGAFGYYGKVYIDEFIYNDFYDVNSKGYFGGGLSSEIQLNIPLEYVNIRPIGVRGSLLYENGEFAQYKWDNLSAIGLYPDYIAMSVSGSSGMDIKLKRSSIGFNVSMGSIITMPHAITDIGYSTNISYNAPKFTVFFQNSGTLLMSNNDLVVGFSYKL